MHEGMDRFEARKALWANVEYQGLVLAAMMWKGPQKGLLHQAREE